jgi:hypothetical protein
VHTGEGEKGLLGTAHGEISFSFSSEESQGWERRGRIEVGQREK